MSTIGENIKRLRNKKGISQDKLSKLADVSLNTIVKLEIGRSPNPTFDTLRKIAKALDITLDQLAEGIKTLDKK
jgi:transcriptional regulator with XRE-family HTH domain